MHRPLSLCVALLATVALAGCSSDPDPAGPTDVDRAATSAGSGTTATTARELAEGCVAETVLTVVTDDGPVEVPMTTSYADIVGAETQSGTFTFSNTAISVDDARGVLQPAGLGEGEVVVIISVQGDGEVTLGTYPPREDAASKALVNFYAVYDETGRLFGTEPGIELTYAADGEVCGRLIGDGTEPGSVSGAFRAERIDTGTVRVP